MTHTRDVRANASEIKFVVDASLAGGFAAWARAHLLADPHGAGDFGDEYDTASQYFDTRGHDVFHRRGSFGRAKYRVRRYGASDVVFLERKLRRPGLLIKRRTATPLAMLARLEAAGPDDAWEGAWFNRRLVARGLRTACQISYHRIARTITLPEGQARLTLDSRLRASAAGAHPFAAEDAVGVLAERVVLELKYRDRLPAIFRRLVEEFGLQPQAASKYRLGMIALGMAPASPVEASDDEVRASYA